MQLHSVARNKGEGVQGRLRTKVFQVRLKSDQETKLNENFVGVIEQEFATKYLESLGIEPTQKNINNLLKNYPLKKCQISAGWNNTGMLADTITIVARKEKLKETKITDPEKLKEAKGGKSFFSNDFVDEMKKVGLKTINIDNLYKNIQRTIKPAETNLPRDEFDRRDGDDEGDGNLRADFYNNKKLYQMDFNLELIKKKYLFPFNISKERKKKDRVEALRVKSMKGGDSLFSSPEFQFPFSEVNVNVNLIKELQAPLNVTFEVIKIQVERFCSEFPFHEIFPSAKRSQQYLRGRMQFDKDSTMGDEKKSFAEEDTISKQLTYLNKMLKIDTNIRFIGLSAHFCYWMVFGNTSPFELDVLFKKQILITLFEVLDSLRDNFPSEYYWANFHFPFILLCLRMITEFIFRTTYPAFFEKQEFADIALDKVNTLLTKLYDPNNLFSRLVYLESEIKAVRKRFDEHIDESKMIKKRLFGVSPFMDMVLPNPADGRVRSLFSVRKKYDGIEQQAPPVAEANEEKKEAAPENDEKSKLEKVYDMRLLYVLLNRINNNLVTKMGNNSNILTLPKLPGAPSNPRQTN